VTLADGGAVRAGQVLSVAELTGLLFKPAPGVHDAIGTLLFTVADPAGNRVAGQASVAIGPVRAPQVVSATRSVLADGGAQALGIGAATDPNDPVGSLVIVVRSLPATGIVSLADGTPLGGAGQVLTPAQLVGLRFTPSPGVLIAVGVTAAIVAGSLLVPVVRQWVLRRTLPTVRQIWPRLIEVMGHPGKVTLALGGNVALTMGYVFAFGASLAAFGQHLPLVQVALVYLVGNAAGAAVPTPGGLGTIEGTLIFGLTASGINPGVAASAAILFRVVTFWLPIPIGWVALHLLRRKDEI